jgi:hypothetical protein
MFNIQMLLNPLEEKLDLPAVAVDIAYFFRRQFELPPICWTVN